MSRLFDITNYPKFAVSVLSTGGGEYSSTLGGGSSLPPFSNVESTKVCSFGSNVSFSQENTPIVIPITTAGIPSFAAKFILIKFKLSQTRSLRIRKGELPSQPGSELSPPCSSFFPDQKIPKETSVPLCSCCTSISMFELILKQRKCESKKIGKNGIDLYVQVVDNTVQSSEAPFFQGFWRDEKNINN
jgi:hypothetical protein